MSAAKLEETHGIEANWHSATCPGKHKAQGNAMPTNALLVKLEHVKIGILATIEPQRRIVKR